MSSSLIPFLMFTALSQQNLLNQQMMSRSSYSSRSRRSYSSYPSSPKLPEKMSVIFDKAKERSKGVSYFDVLMMRAIHSDEKVQQVLLHLEKNYTSINKQTKEKVIAQIQDIAAKTENAYKKAQSQLSSIESMGFKVEYPYREYKLFFAQDDYNAEGVLPSSEKDNGYRYKGFEFPKTINGLDLNSDAFKLPNPFEKPLNDYLKENPDNETNLQVAKATVEKLSKSKFALMFSKKKRIELDKAQMELSKQQSIAYNIARHQKNAEFYKNLTNEQKAIFADFIQNVKIIKALSNDVKKYIEAEHLIDKNASRAYPTEKINTYHSAVVKQAACALSQDEILTLAEFEERASNKILSLSDAQAKEIIKNSSGLTTTFEIDGKVIDSSILYELSDSCHERISELNIEKEKAAENTAGHETVLER